MTKEGPKPWALWVVSLFFVLWVYTEIKESIERDATKTQLLAELRIMRDFRAKGDRFTPEDAKVLEERLIKECRE